MSDDRAEDTVHGTAVLLDECGVLITGAAGAGKTSLALTLIRRARSDGHAAGLVADDRVVLSSNMQGVAIACPEPIIGQVEVRGWGIADVSDLVVGPARLALLVRLVPAAQAQRFAMDSTETVQGHDIPCLHLPAGPPSTAATAVFAALGLPIWL